MKNKEFFWEEGRFVNRGVSDKQIFQQRLEWGRASPMWVCEERVVQAETLANPVLMGACLMFCRRGREVSSARVEWNLWLLLRWCLFGGRKTRRENPTKPNRIQSFKKEIVANAKISQAIQVEDNGRKTPTFRKDEGSQIPLARA